MMFNMYYTLNIIAISSYQIICIWVCIARLWVLYHAYVKDGSKSKIGDTSQTWTKSSSYRERVIGLLSMYCKNVLYFKRLYGVYNLHHILISASFKGNLRRHCRLEMSSLFSNRVFEDLLYSGVLNSKNVIRSKYSELDQVKQNKRN